MKLMQMPMELFVLHKEANSLHGSRNLMDLKKVFLK